MYNRDKPEQTTKSNYAKKQAKLDRKMSMKKFTDQPPTLKRKAESKIESKASTSSKSQKLSNSGLYKPNKTENN